MYDPGAPEIVVEILSPGNNKKEIKIKYDLYEEFGVKEYWVVYPDEQSLIRYILNDEGEFTTNCCALRVIDRLTTPILPGFELAMDDLFANSFEQEQGIKHTLISSIY